MNYEQVGKVRELLRDEVIAMRSGYKNAVSEHRHVANGVVLAAYHLGIFTGEQRSAAVDWISAEASRRELRGLVDSDRFDLAASASEASYKGLFK